LCKKEGNLSGILPKLTIVKLPKCRCKNPGCMTLHKCAKSLLGSARAKRGKE